MSLASANLTSDGEPARPQTSQLHRRGLTQPGLASLSKLSPLARRLDDGVHEPNVVLPLPAVPSAVQRHAADPRLLPAATAHPRVSVIVPTYNEAKNLPHVFSRLPEDLHEVIVVDGHSIDGTVEVA